MRESVQKPCQASQSTNLGSPVKVKFPAFLIILLLSAAAVSSQGQNADSQPVTTTDLAAWLTGGVSSSRLARLAADRKVANLPTHAEIRQLQAAGAGKDLVKVLNSGNVESAQIGPAIPEGILKAAAEARQQHFHEAETDLRSVIAARRGKFRLALRFGRDAPPAGAV